MLDTAARAAGSVLAGTFAVVARLRPTIKPLHPRGVINEAALTRHGLTPGTGVPWLDEPGYDRVLVRRSNAAGMPSALPDVRGMALRVPVGPERFADLLLATTGTRPLARHLLTVTTSDRHPMSTLLPYRSPSGPLLLGVMPGDSDTSFAVCCAGLRGPWRRFGTLELDDSSGSAAADDPDIRFDPVRGVLPGLSHYRWVTRLREPAYRAARANSPG